MSPGSTRTGWVLEQMVIPALRHGGYKVDSQGWALVVGQAPSGRPYRADLVATTPEGEKLIISLKWQQTSGTAEQKVPYEVITLMHILKTQPGFRKAYVVLGGDGWTLRDFYVSGELRKCLPYGEEIEILTLEAFVARANKGQL